MSNEAAIKIIAHRRKEEAWNNRIFEKAFYVLKHAGETYNTGYSVFRSKEAFEGDLKIEKFSDDPHLDIWYKGASVFHGGDTKESVACYRPVHPKWEGDWIKLLDSIYTKHVGYNAEDLIDSYGITEAEIAAYYAE